MPLTPRVYWGSLELTAYPYALIFGADFGAPEVVVQTLVTFLQDGEYEISDRSSNRTFTLPILTEGANLSALATAEANLALEARKPLNTLRIDPGDGAPSTVFDTFVGEINFARDDEYEKNSLRVWNATISALPSGRDAVVTTVQATSTPPTTPPTPVTAVIDSGSATTGWSARSVPNGNVSTVTTDGSAVTATATNAPLAMRKTVSIDVAATRLVYFDWTSDTSDTSKVEGYLLDGSGTLVSMALLSQAPLTGGQLRTYFQVPSSFGSTATGVEFRVLVRRPIGLGEGTSVTASIDQVVRTNQSPIQGTNRQQSRSLTVGGSARARAALTITADAGKTLGDLTLLYTRSATTGLQPPLRPYRVSSATVTSGDATALASISGAYNSLGTTPMVCNIPANRFQEAAHDLVLRLRATTAGTYTVTWTAALASSTNADLPETVQSITGSTSVTFAAANTWQTTDLGQLGLPTVPVAPDSTNMIRLTLAASSAVVQIDEGWLFDMNNGVLSWVNSTALTRLEVRTPDLTLPRPSYWGGTVDGGAATGLVRADWRCSSYTIHTFEPGTIDIFTVTSGTEGSSASATYYRAWHTHAAA